MELQRASWTQCGEMKIYAFNRKHQIKKGLEKKKKAKISCGERGNRCLGTCVPVFTSCPDPLLPEAASKGSVLSLMSH